MGQLRLIDANLNRLKEGVRVVEEIARFIFNNANLSKKLKTIRHKARITNLLEALQEREVIGDVLRAPKEENKATLEAIAIANFKRAEESARVLEEFSKLSENAERFKAIRYEIYDLEKEFFALLAINTSNSK
ncbi:MAG: hypothetical protein RL154_371 [Pseudomonadota bacterium]